MENSEDPDQKPSDMDQHCFLKRIYLGSAGSVLNYNDTQIETYLMFCEESN